MFRRTLSENIKVALRAIRSQILRTTITIFIIALGIMALVAMVTATEAIKAKIQDEFSILGSNTFTVGNKQNSGGRRGQQEKSTTPFTYEEAVAFKKNYDFDAMVSLNALGSFGATVQYESEKTNPTVRVLGVDENYLELSGFEIQEGRNYSVNELLFGQNVVIVGMDVVDAIFEKGVSAIEKEVSIGSYKYLVIGVLKPKGQGMGISSDNQCLIPLSNLKKQFATPRTEYSVNVLVKDPIQMDAALSEAYGVARVVRGDGPADDESFEVSKSSQLIETLLEGMAAVSAAAVLIGIITLFSAGIGLMNIMLVSVTERTKEIGVRKAIGASSKTVLIQFLVEAIVIGQIGGAVGIILGIGIGNMISLIMDTPFVIPWFWIFVGVTLCMITSIISGFYPAWKASKLDPIEALRHE
jgi:putative ABC transport system permease protein